MPSAFQERDADAQDVLLEEVLGRTLSYNPCWESQKGLQTSKGRDLG